MPCLTPCEALGCTHTPIPVLHQLDKGLFLSEGVIAGEIRQAMRTILHFCDSAHEAPGFGSVRCCWLPRNEGACTPPQLHSFVDRETGQRKQAVVGWESTKALTSTGVCVSPDELSTPVAVPISSPPPFVEVAADSPPHSPLLSNPGSFGIEVLDTQLVAPQDFKPWGRTGEKKARMGHG